MNLNQHKIQCYTEGNTLKIQAEYQHAKNLLIGQFPLSKKVFGTSSYYQRTSKNIHFVAFWWQLIKVTKAHLSNLVTHPHWGHNLTATRQIPRSSNSVPHPGLWLRINNLELCRSCIHILLSWILIMNLPLRQRWLLHLRRSIWCSF